MEVKVKTYATLRKYAPSNTGLGEAFSLNFEGESINEIIDELGFDKKIKLIVMINGVRTSNYDQKVKSEDLIVFFPQLGGG